MRELLEKYLEIYRNNGMPLRMNRADIQEKVKQYLSFVEQAGFQNCLKNQIIGGSGIWSKFGTVIYGGIYKSHFRW